VRPWICPLVDGLHRALHAQPFFGGGGGGGGDPAHAAPRRLAWAQSATFAVGSATVRARPRWLYRQLLRMSEVEEVCDGVGSYGWSHAMERLWLVLFNVARPLHPTVQRASKVDSAYFARVLCGRFTGW